MVKELMVEINQAQKFSQYLLRRRAREISDNLHFIIEWSSPLATDVVSKESRFLYTEHTLQWVDDNAIFVEAAENRAQMLLVFLSTQAGHEDIVIVCVCKGEARKNLVNKALERLCSVAKTKSLKGVVITVFGISACSTGIWWYMYSLIRSNMEKTVHP